MNSSKLKQVFRTLETGYGYTAAAANREFNEPPFQKGRATEHADDVHAALVMVQKELKNGN